MGHSQKTETGCRPDQLFGAWAIEPERFAAMVEEARNTDLAAARAASSAAAASPSRPYSLHNGIATIELSGPMTKYPTSFQSVFGGTSSVLAGRALRRAVRDPQVQGILLQIDSPGGTVAGTDDLAAEVRAANSKKPVFAHIEDLGASAAYYVASQARHISANRSGGVGSIGVFSVLHDSSGRAEQQGVQVYVVHSGGVKGTGVPGAPVTEEQLAHVQEFVDAHADLFVQAIAEGRGMDADRARELADGRIHVGEAARDAGLIDAVGSVDDARRQLLRESKMAPEDAQAAEELIEEADQRTQEAEAKVATLEARVAELEATARGSDPEETDELAGLSPAARSRIEAAEQKAASAQSKADKLEADARAKLFETEAGKFACLPIKPKAFGPVLEAADRLLSKEHAAELVRVLQAADAQAKEAGILAELGSSADAAEGSGPAWQQIDQLATKRMDAGEFATKALAIAAVCKDRKDLYAQHRAEQKGRAN